MADANMGVRHASRKATTIYALRDPRDGAIRYIGKSVNPKNRLSCHCWEATAFDTPKARWLLALREAGLEPAFDVLEIVPPGGDWIEAEQRHISAHRAAGHDLFNLASGGQGPDGTVRDEKWRAAQAATRINNPRRIAGAKRAGEKKRGKKHTPEHCAAMSAALKGRRISDEQKAILSALKKGKRPSDATLEGSRAYHTGRKHTAETKAKMSAAAQAYAPERSKRHRERWQDPEFRERNSAWRRGRALSTEHRESLRKSSSAGWADEEVRKRRVDGIRAATSAPQYKEAHRARMRAKWKDPEFKAMMMAARKK